MDTKEKSVKLKTMRALGMIRKIDHLGRITVPRELLKIWGYSLTPEKDEFVEIFEFEDGVFLRKAEAGKDHPGIIRNLDRLGRCVIASEVRRKLGYHAGTMLEMFTCDGGLYIKKYGNPILHTIDQTMKELSDFKNKKGEGIADILEKQVADLEKTKTVIEEHIGESF